MTAASDEGDYEPSEVESGQTNASDDSMDRADQAISRYGQRGRHNERDVSDSDEHDSSSISATSATSRKRPLALPDYLTGAPMKRQRRTFNPDYLSLLNQDIADASAGFAGSGLTPSNLQPSQLGAVRWTAVEKESFFSALGRLGRDDLPGIAARIGTKGALEVRQYMMLLTEREQARERDDGVLGGRRKKSTALRPVEVPAAVEVGHECCVALEQAADDLALRQDNHEVAAEERRWGDHWLVTRKVVEELGERPMDEMPFMGVFHVGNWLALSERVFLNSAIPEFHWRSVSEEAPTIRATALSDFHALVVSLTKRLVASVLFMAGSRIKAQRQYMPFTKNLVKAKDVRAAVESLGLKTDSHNFWARAPRRLRMDVVQENSRSGDEAGEQESNDEETILSYDEVEATLGASSTPTTPISQSDGSSSDIESSEDDLSSSLLDDTDESAGSTAEETDVEMDIGINDEAVKQDMREAMFFSVDYEGTTRARQGLQRRIKAEHAMEAEAEDHDIASSRQEEAQLWTTLRQAGTAPATPARRLNIDKPSKRAVYEPLAKNWRNATNYVGEWETQGND